MRAPRKPSALKAGAMRVPAAKSADEASGSASGPAPRRQAGRPRVVKSKPDQPANDAKVVELDKYRKKYRKK